MGYVMITKNQRFEKVISNYFKEKNENLLIVNSLGQLFADYYSKSFNTIIIDQDYIKLDILNIYLFIKSYRLKLVFLIINSKDLSYNKIENIKTHNIELLKKQNKYTSNKKYWEIYISFLDYLSNLFDSINNISFRKRERELLTYLCNQEQNTISIEVLVKCLWNDSNPLNINKHKKTIYSYISRINSIYKNNTTLDLKIVYAHKKYYLEYF